MSALKKSKLWPRALLGAALALGLTQATLAGGYGKQKVVYHVNYAPTRSVCSPIRVRPQQLCAGGLPLKFYRAS